MSNTTINVKKKDRIMVWKPKKEITKKKEQMGKLLLIGMCLGMPGCLAALGFLNSTKKIWLTREDAEEIRLISKHIKCNELMDRIYRIYHKPFEDIQQEYIESWPSTAA